MQVTVEQVRAQVRHAFKDVAMPARSDDLLMPKYRDSDDAVEMAVAVAGHRWDSLPLSELFRHREALAMTSARGYQALLPAYLLACVDESPDASKYSGDFWEFTVMSLHAWEGQRAEDAALVPERLSLLTTAQRDAVRTVLQYIAARSSRRDAQAVLASW